MDIFTRDMNFVKFNNQEMEWVKFNGVTVWEGWKTLTSEGVPPLTLQKCANENMLGYKIYGKSTQSSSPTPSSPVDILSVGNQTINLYGGQNTYTVSGVTNETPNQWYVMKANKTYTIAIYVDNSNATSNAGFRMSVGYSSGSWNYNSSNTISGGNKGWAIKSFKVPSNYNNSLNMQYQPGTGGTTYSQIMLLEGSYTVAQLPSYEPFGYNIPITVTDANNNTTTTNILLNAPLRKFGSYIDYIDFENQKVYRNVQAGILNGKEGWSSAGTRFYYSTNNLNIKALGTGVVGIMSDDLPGTTWSTIRNSGTGIATYSDNRIDIRYTDWSSVDDAKTYLKANLLNYIAPALNPTEQSLELPDILLNKGTNIVSVDTTTTPSNMWIKYKGKE